MSSVWVSLRIMWSQLMPLVKPDWERRGRSEVCPGLRLPHEGKYTENSLLIQSLNGSNDLHGVFGSSGTLAQIVLVTVEPESSQMTISGPRLSFPRLVPLGHLVFTL